MRPQLRNGDYKNSDFSFEADHPNENYSVLTNTFSLIVEKHAPFTKKTEGRNYATFIPKDLKKNHLHKK